MNENLEELARLLAPLVASILASTSQGVDELRKVKEIANVFSLPAIERIGDREEVVEVALTSLIGGTGKTPVLTFVISSLPYGTEPTASVSGEDDAPTIAIGFPLAQNGDKPVWEKTATGISIKYSRDPESAYTSLFSFADVMPDVSDFSKEGIELLQKPATDAANRLNALSDHRDKVVDGYWWRWNEVTDTWHNTGEIAKGNVMYATFDVDLSTGKLVMVTPDEYTGPAFSLTPDGDLCVTINE